MGPAEVEGTSDDPAVATTPVPDQPYNRRAGKDSLQTAAHSRVVEANKCAQQAQR